MSQLPAVGTTSGVDTSSGTTAGANDLRDLELDQFLQLMIAELQNQDPLNPLDNSEILQQISQIREISATNQLNETLDAVLTGQNLSTASSLIGKQVTALSDSGGRVENATITRVSVETDTASGVRQLRVHTAEDSIALQNISEILDPGPAE